MCLKWTNNVNNVLSNMAARNVIHLRGHPLDQGKCPLNRGVPSMEVGLGFVNNNQKWHIFIRGEKGICSGATETTGVIFSSG